MDSPKEDVVEAKGAKPKVPPRPIKLKMGTLSPLMPERARPVSPGPKSPRPPSVESEERRSNQSPPVNRLRQRFGRLFSIGSGGSSQPPSPTSSDKWSPCSSDGFEELNSPRESRKKRHALTSVSSEPAKPQSPGPIKRFNNWKSKSDSAKVVRAMRHGVISPPTPAIRVYSLSDGPEERGMIAAKKMVPAVLPPSTPAKMFAPLRGERGSWHRIFRLPQLLLSTVC